MSLVRLREAYEREEIERLAPYAVKSSLSRGRVVPEREHAYRTAFQRDRDRVIHSRAFRRLEYKTQVFVHHEGDHYRNRLTHTLEGAQVARTLARALRLNEDLAEAIILAHDLGHTPFGHAGERVLDALLEHAGGFDHNRQSLRIVDLLEERHPDYRGLNLTSETREGILKHGASWEHPVPLPPATPSHALEAQLADLADEIAYTNHDLDDGLRAGLLGNESLEEVDLWREARATARERLGVAEETVLRAQTIVALLDGLATDLVEATAGRLEAAGASSADAVRALPRPCVGFSDATRTRFAALKRHLFQHFYMHPHVRRRSGRAERVLGDLFHGYREDPRRLPEHVRARFAGDGELRAIADYIAGMTDRFALAEHARLRRAGDGR
ncbi:MAG: deoxyguanosinetriphosphate triphosphohydrolase [Deltaproteobacteria bacterium]|nr:deoxyguanosinetriphosphate triphosphohydrolase [Deltaproteobacteria bacterium]